MNDNESLELKIKSSADQTNQALESVINNLRQVNVALKGTTSAINSLNSANRKIKGTSNSASGSIKNVKKDATSLKSVFKSVFDVGKIYAFWNVTKGIRDGIKSMVSNAIDFIETTNKFEVSMGSMKDKGTQFIDSISEKFGLARETLMNYQATYNNIMKSLPRFNRRSFL